MTGPPENAGDANELPFRINPTTGEILDDVNLATRRTDTAHPRLPTAERLARLEAAQGHLHQALSAILDRLETDASCTTQPVPSRWSWHHLGDDDRQRLWAELRSFVDWLIDRYQPDGSARIPRCWHRHPVAVEELTALMVAWRYAYCAGDAITDALSDWHGHRLWPTLDRLGERAQWRQCTTRKHERSESVAPTFTAEDSFPPAPSATHGDPLYLAKAAGLASTS